MDHKQAAVQHIGKSLLQSQHRELRILQCRAGGEVKVEINGILPSFYMWQLLNQAVLQATLVVPELKLQDVKFNVKVGRS